MTNFWHKKLKCCKNRIKYKTFWPKATFQKKKKPCRHEILLLREAISFPNTRGRHYKNITITNDASRVISE
jgi:hypothetical protein